MVLRFTGYFDNAGSPQRGDRQFDVFTLAVAAGVGPHARLGKLGNAELDAFAKPQRGKGFGKVYGSD